MFLLFDEIKFEYRFHMGNVQNWPQIPETHNDKWLFDYHQNNGGWWLRNIIIHCLRSGFDDMRFMKSARRELQFAFQILYWFLWVFNSIVSHHFMRRYTQSVNAVSISLPWRMTNKIYDNKMHPITCRSVEYVPHTGNPWQQTDLSKQSCRILRRFFKTIDRPANTS